jgi:hypothetical protein
MMRKGYKIGLFFVLLLTAAIIVILWMRLTVVRQNMTKAKEEVENPVVETGYSQIKTNCDTICIYEDIDQKDGSMTITEDKLPAKYIGLKREEFEVLLADDSKVYTLDDHEKGFKSQHLELFSSEQVKILRIYDSTPKFTGYYIMEVDGEIVVYEGDKETLYFRTGLNPDSLPENIRRQVKSGKFMDTELQVYHFIESYSS